LTRERPDAALLDGPATPVAEACAARGVRRFLREVRQVPG